MRARDAMKLISDVPFPGGLSQWNDGSEFGALIYRLVSGDWHATGRRARDRGNDPSKRDVIPVDLWEVLKIDPNKDSAAGSGLEFVAVRFQRGARPAPTAAKRPGRKPGGGAYDDSKAVAEMRRLLDDGTAKSKSQAANMATHLARGPATLESKARRLRDRFSKLETK